jgi:hypothetical protein
MADFKQTVEGFGLIGVTICAMLVFSVGTLLVIFVFHSALTALYAFASWSGIPFLIVLAAPLWITLAISLCVKAVRLLKHVA